MDDARKPKLLYIMGIDWNWIYQRPQIIEKHLENDYEVTVVFPRSVMKAFAKPRCSYPQRYKVLWTLPLQEKSILIGKISKLLNRHIFKNINDYGMVVIGYPLYYRYISEYSGILIYDCMDNHEALYCYPAGVTELLKQETLLVSHSNLIFVSSQMLAEKLKKYDIVPLPQMVLLRNGTDIPDMLSPIALPALRKQYRLGYIGTIADWFDKDLILESLRQHEDIEYHLIGPVNITLPSHKRLVMKGVVPHELLYSAMQDYCCLIMPFLLKEVILYVDPVKLYEYIVMGKCIISVYYPEIEHFKDFVYFYHSTSEYIQLLSMLKAEGFPPKYTLQQREDFLKENSWQSRFSTWDKAVKCYIP